MTIVSVVASFLLGFGAWTWGYYYGRWTERKAWHRLIWDERKKAGASLLQ